MRALGYRWWLIGAGVLLLVVGAVLVAVLLGALGGSSPERDAAELLATASGIELAEPPSMEDIAAEYPELAPILGDPELGAVYKEFLLAYQEGGMDAAVALAEERGLLTPDGQHLRVTLVLDTEDADALVSQLEAVGVEVVSAYKDRVNISVAIVLIEQALQADDVSDVFQQLTELDHVIAVRLPGERSSDTDAQIDSNRPNGQSTEGEGVGAIGADVWHQAGLTGAGVRIGVLDLGFLGYEDLLGTELPASVELATFGWYDDEEVHGTACAEIVHEVAPDAQLFLAWYDGSDAAMGEAVDWLVANDVDIITHSAGGAVSPRDGTGWDSRLVDETTARGILWVNSAGNEADVHYREVFNDLDGDGFHDYAHGSSVLPIQTSGYLQVYLIWQESWESPTQDYELLILNGAGDVLATSEEAQDGTPGQQPAEYLALETDEPIVYAAVYAYAVDRNLTFDIFAAGPGAEIVGAVPAYSVTSPGDALTSLTVGAVAWADDALEYYSSQGPTTDERLKPEISGPTRVSGYTYGQEGFDGTSASAPHVAGAAALVWQAYPAFTREELVEYLLSASIDLGPAGPDTGYGYGRLTLPAPPEAMIGLPTPTPMPTVAAVGTVVGSSDLATSTPGPLMTPTPVAFATSEPVEEEGRNAGTLVLALVVLAGFGLGGGGLLLVGGALLIVDFRSRRRDAGQRNAGQRNAGRPNQGRSGRPSPARPPVPRPVERVGPAPAAAPGAPLGATQIWMPSSDAPQRPAAAGGAGASADSGVAADGGTPAVGVPPARCPACNAEVRPGARFCPACGRRLDPEPQAGYCDACGAPLAPGSSFCTECGKAV